MNDEKTIMERLARAFPAEVVQQKPGRGGSKPLSYISHALVTERLNEVDPGWSWRVLTEHIWFDQGGQPHCAGVTVEMTVNGVTRVEAGGPQRQEAFTNEIKNAYSDALKRAAMRFGVALYIWDSMVDAQDDEDAQGAPRRPAQGAPEPQERRAVDAQHERNTHAAQGAPARPSSLPATRSRPAPSEPNGQEMTRARVEAAMGRHGLPILPIDTYEEIAETVNRALANAGKDIEVKRDRDGKAAPGDILNALMALPSAVPA